MSVQVEMPRLSDETEEGVLVAWFVEPGSVVREGDLVAEIQVEKTSAEVRAPAGGRIARLLVAAGSVVGQGAPILEIVSPDEASPPAAAGLAAAVIASPAAKRLARELGVEIAGLVGSGPGGRIVEDDVRAAAAGPGARTGGSGAPAGPAVPIPDEAAAAIPAEPATSAPTAAGAARVEPLTSMRRTIADRLRGGLAATAQLTLTAEADLTDLKARLDALPAVDGRRPSPTEALVRACALALRDHPRLMARLTPEGIAYPDRIDVGVAVALDDGLIVPVVRDADTKDIATLGAEIAAAAARARAGSLTSAEIAGATFTITNLGRYRIDAFTPLLDPPQSAILGVGRARPRPAVVDGALAVRRLVILSLTIDHQVVDGAPAAAFLDDVIGLLEAPDLVLA